MATHFSWWPLCATVPGVKYSVRVSRRGPQQMRLTLGGVSVDVVGRKLNDGGLLIQVRGGQRPSRDSHRCNLLDHAFVGCKDLVWRSMTISECAQMPGQLLDGQPVDDPVACGRRPRRVAPFPPTLLDA